MLTVAHPEDTMRPFYGVGHPDALFRGGRHGLLAKDVETLLDTLQDDFSVHLVLDSDDDLQRTH